MGSEVVLPSTGELVDLSEMPTDEIAGQVGFYADISQAIGRFRRAASDELASRLDHEGRRSGDVGEYHIEVNAPTVKDWDPDKLAATLDKFVEEGVISQDKATRCLRVKTEPVWSEVKTLMSDPRTAPEISLCYEDEPAVRQIKVSPINKARRHD